ncbi:hypothetical protein IMAU30056_00371 [Lactobacillus helveticus]|nr:hypothetical protein [Lactobacillus helveticus]
MNTRKILQTDLQQMVFLGMVVAMKIILGQISFGSTTVKNRTRFCRERLVRLLIWSVLGDNWRRH